MINGIQVELKPLRKNSKNAGFIVIEVNSDGATDKLTYYETLREAVYHAMQAKNGDIVRKGASKYLLLHYSKWTNTMRFGFGAHEWDKVSIVRDLWWANIDQAPLN